ncbi:MAG: response regulator transcription factor [Propionibacteriaceae bacterium]|jgi:DNA-binding NarL/FixJ family response regulator|nr:response regulator transcription factor [Propionibacteriaceae bacterium]
MVQPFTVVLVDDDSGSRRRYRTMLTGVPHITIIGEASNGRDGVAIWLKRRPDLVLMDLNMPVMSGEEATRRIHLVDPMACVVALTQSETADHVRRAVEAGVAGYLLKATPMQEIGAALGDALNGWMPLSAPIRVRIAELLRAGTPVATNSSLPCLTPRETEVVRCLVKGLSNRGIARELSLAEGTVRQHLARLSAKLDAHSRVQILLRVTDLGLFDTSHQV